MSAAADILSRLQSYGAAVERLRAMAPNPPQCVLLEGGDQQARTDMALYWAMLLNCEESEKPCTRCAACKQVADRVFNDLLTFGGGGERVPVQSVRETRPVWGQPPNGDGYRVTIFFEANLLNPECSNALLKSLEEPRPGNVFVLLSPQRERLLDTLVSRSWVVTMAWPDVRQNDPDISQWVGAMLSFWGSGQGWFERTSAKGSVDRQLALDVVLGLQRELREAMAGSNATPHAQGLSQRLGPAGLRKLDLALWEAQDALNTATPVNPAMVLDWVATRLV